MPRGRPPATRNVLSFEQAILVPPSAVTLDTSFVIEALVTTQPLHEQCQTFLLALAGADSVLVFNRLLEVELWEAVLKIAIKERFPRDWSRRRPDGRVLRRARRLLVAVEDAWTEVLRVMRHATADLEEVRYLAPHLMTFYGVSSYDAVHAATAIHLGVEDFVTIDVGFRAIPQDYLRLWVDSSRVASCRGGRRFRASAPLPRT